MKTITKVFKVYDINEIEKIGKENMKNAMESLTGYVDDIVQFDFDDYERTMKAVAERFNIKILDYSFGLFQYGNHVYSSIAEYMESSNAEKNSMVAEINKMIKDKELFNDEFTGVWSDYYFIKYFTENEIEEVTYNDLHFHLRDLLGGMTSIFIKDKEEQHLSDKFRREIAIENNMYFYEDGTLYGEVNDEI